jgi:hypothetical protein
MEIVRVEMDLRRLRHNDGESEERKSQREQIEVLKLELNSSNSHLVALKYEVSKTQVSRGVYWFSCQLNNFYCEKIGSS